MLYFLFSFVLSLIFIKLVIKFAPRLHLMDIPKDRSHHTNIMPRGAGIGFLSAFFLSITLFHLSLFLQYWYVFLATFLVFIAGILDDRHEMSAKKKFIFIFVSVWILWINGLSIDDLGSWLGYDIKLPSLIALFFSMFAIAGFTNALNLIDGLDGLAGSISLVVFSYFYLIGYENADNFIMIVSSTMSFVLLGFLVFNWNPAKIFMGDSGSLTLGFAISMVSILSIKYVHPVVILYIAALPIIDTVVVMTRRIKRGESPFSPDKTHVHHILINFFESSVKKTVIFLTLFQLVLSGIGYMLQEKIDKDHSYIMPLISLAGFIVILILTYMVFTGMLKRQILLENKNNL